MALREGPFSEIKVPLTLAAGAAVAVALIIGFVLLSSDRRDTLEEKAYGTVQETADRIQKPVGEVLNAPVRGAGAVIDGVRSFFGAIAENPRLRRENKRIPNLEAKLAYEHDQNERLRAILGLKTDPPLPMITARAVTDSRGPFANARLVNKGQESGIKVGYPAMSENGLVGRVTGTSKGVSRILLLTDVTSRIPVMIDRNNARAILTGDGGAYPHLANMRSRDPPKLGDTLVTSGDGGVFPRGLPVGVVVKGVDGSWRAQLSSDRAPIDYVRIVQFEDFTQLADQAALSATVAPVQMGGAISPPQAPAPILKVAPKLDPKAPPATPGQAKAPVPPAAAPPKAPTLKAVTPNAAAPKTAAPEIATPKAAAPKAAAPKAAPPEVVAPKAAAPKTASPPPAPPAPPAAPPKVPPITSTSPKGPPTPTRQLPKAAQ